MCVIYMNASQVTQEIYFVKQMAPFDKSENSLQRPLCTQRENKCDFWAKDILPKQGCTKSIILCKHKDKCFS